MAISKQDISQDTLPALAPAGRARGAVFNNPAVVTQSWYMAARSRQLGRGRTLAVELGGRQLVLYRDEAGTPHAMEARCPHLGAHLALGKVEGDGLRCAFHHWSFGPDGACRDAPGLPALPQRRARLYPCQERWGLIWIFNGPRPLFDLPQLPEEERLRVLRPPVQHIRCHPHLVIANGLDSRHFEALHDMESTAPPRLSVEPPYGITLELSGRPRSRLWQAFTGTRQQPIVASFTTTGANLAVLSFHEPMRFYTLFSARPSAQGGCHTQTLLFLPAGLSLLALRAVAMMYVLLHDDRPVLDTLDFHPSFTEADGPLRTFVELVDRMDTW